MTETETPVIDLVYFAGCPNADEARANLKGVLGSLGLPGDWREWVQDEEDTPSWVRALPSPTILIGGRNVLRTAPGVKGPACASGGAPPAEAIRQALTGRGGS